MYVKAAPGLVIRDPVFLDLLPPEGREVPESDYWQRRLLDRDVERAEPPPVAVLDTNPASSD